MVDESVKESLHAEIQQVREALIWKLDGLSEYDIRRPMTASGTNLLGLVKHSASWEARYFGEVFGRPFPGPLVRWQDSDGSDLWVTPEESREQIVDFYRTVWSHADATITGLPSDTPGLVEWWPRPEVKLIDIVWYMLVETTRHAGHADILREQIDGRAGISAEREENFDVAARQALWNRIEDAAKKADSLTG